MKLAVILCVWITALTGLYLLGRHWATRQRSRERVLNPMNRTSSHQRRQAMRPSAFSRDGYTGQDIGRRAQRRPFVAWTMLTGGLGFLLGFTMYVSGMTQEAGITLTKVPGGVGDILVPIVALAPYLFFITLASLPAAMVRAARRKRVAQVEQDLPLILELLATLSEAGLGFDAALERVLQSQPAQRTMTQEFRIFQMEILAGRPRIQCLRRLGWRLDVTSLTIFISALVQTEQVGAGVADVLRHQADDLRGRRREQALTAASSMPVKLLFPLVICFLPGILVATLGPTFFQIFQFLDSLFRARGGR